METPDVYRAICQVAKAMSRDGIAKDKENGAQHYRFRGIDDIYNALSAVLAGAELCILPRMVARTVEERVSKSGGAMFYVTVQAEYDFVSVRDGSKHTVTTYGEAMDSADKATNKAMSAAYKYACMQTFCIPTEGMEDADGDSPEPMPKATGPVLISVAQAKRMYAIGKTAGKTNPQMVAILKRHGFDTSADVTQSMYDVICKELEAK